MYSRGTAWMFRTIKTICKVAETHLEVQNNRPDQAERQLRIAVDNVLCPNVDQFDLFVAQKV